MERNFGGVVWTNHALKRLTERNISQGDAWAAFRRPEQSEYAKAKGAWIYYKTYGNQRIEVVAKQNEKKEWIILSVWSRQVFKKTKKMDSLAKLLWKRIFKK
ncbi:DUF4258 domain-containing protein [Patescibacteria group bacterium]|nr:DUF4258 domain-containing protein [Patescibacteria group bacterium]MBU0776861.1 DUF4258 domain-containing protein [Patescibacteria group bacterium]MBU0922607.1 DUF4258 domain-containing protein [Patescibacteria group bacterium]MBU1066658.1 DUF4258 domain-containing protein [Patescibacteria group bacterium]MBU1845080.1 DUF4258 domain-containing protein [Patescibacteria group bacterium]